MVATDFSELRTELDAAGAPPGSDGRLPTPGDRLPVGAAAAVLAILALLFASVALLIGGRGDEAGSDSAAVNVELSEFAIEPATIEVPESGSLHVSNDGQAVHDLSITGTDLTTGDIPPGSDATLDLSSLAPGSYEVFCSIPGHKDSGMSGSLVIGVGSGAAAGADAAAGAAHGQHMTESDYQRMDEAMQATIGEFPAETAGVGNTLLEPTVLPDGTKQFDLTAGIVEWEVAPGQVVEAWTYNGIVPAPSIRLAVGDKVQIILHNDLPMGTDLHVHGVDVPNAMDGVSPLTQDLVQPGEDFTYEFVADEPAVAMYHAHHHAQLQVPNGMFGTIFVGDVNLPRGSTVSGIDVPADLALAQDLPMVLNDAGTIGYSINGKSFPATTPIAAKVGDWILVHYFNEGTQIHPMHLHQFDQIVVAKDGFPLDHPYAADTLNVAPGERYSVLVHLDTPGAWVWHCHILPHVERDTGMFGMVTALVVEE